MTATYDTAAGAYTKQVQWLVEIDLPVCSLTYTQGDCAASDAGDGSRCHYSYSTCQDQTNFTLGSRTYYFCLNDVPWDDPANAVYPLLRKRVPIPQKIHPKKLSVFPEEIKVDMLLDFAPPAQNPGKGSGFFNTSTAGEFWKNLKARHPNYAGSAVRVKRGFHESGFLLADFAQVGPEYTLKAIKISKHGVQLTAESPLKILDRRKVPWVISEDNTLQTLSGTGGTSLVVNDGGEFPDPADFDGDGNPFVRNTIYVEIDPDGAAEICEVTAVSGNTLTVVRGVQGTTAASHANDGTVIVKHIAVWGQTVDGNEYQPVNPIDVINDLLEWAGVTTSKISANSFTNVKAGAWPADDVKRKVRKSTKIGKLMQQIREPRGVIVYVDQAGTFSVAVMAPNDTTNTVIDDDSIIMDSVQVLEDTENRITRASLWYDPTKDNAKDPDDFNKAVVLINAELEGPNVFGDKVDEEILDLWVNNTTVSDIRVLLKRLLARRAYGERIVRFDLEVKDATLNVGDTIILKTRHITDGLGNIVARPLLITARGEAKRNTVTYEGADTTYAGRFLRIGPDTMATTYDAASEEDKAYGYWGNATTNRVGAKFEEGYRFF